MSAASARPPAVRHGLAAALALLALPARAQELEPRAYSPSPTGLNFILLSYARTQGGVVFDPSLPFRDVEATLNAPAALYGRTFGLFGRSANTGIGIPYAWGEVQGNVGEEFRRVTRSGLADLRARFAVNLIGGPALTRQEFATRRPRTTLGASVVIVAPTGQYDPRKLINIGANRWAFKPELGLSRPFGRLMAELYAGAWIFTDNADFYGGQRREQQALGALQGHLSYTFKPRLWISADATFYTGGKTTVGGVSNADLQRNTRAGLTLSLPIRARQSLKLAWGSGVTTRIGGDFDTVSAAWQVQWF